MMYAPQPTMDDKRHSFASSITNCISSLFVADLITSPSTNAYMQCMHPTHFYNQVSNIPSNSTITTL